MKHCAALLHSLADDLALIDEDSVPTDSLIMLKHAIELIIRFVNLFSKPNYTEEITND